MHFFVLLGAILLLSGVIALTPGVAPNPGHVITSVAPPAPCEAGQFLQFDGTNWVCEFGEDIWESQGENKIFYEGSVGFFEFENSGQTPTKQVCVDHYGALYYERNGDIASVYLAGANTAGTIGSNCGGNPSGEESNGKKLFYRFDWRHAPDDASVTISATMESPSVQATYTKNTPNGHKTTFPDCLHCSGGTGSFSGRINSITWSNNKFNTNPPSTFIYGQS